MMYDGSTKMVQDIVLGDIVMGDDSTPRNVSSLARGNEMMYRVNCQNGDVFTVNESHVLCLRYGNSMCMYHKHEGELFDKMQNSNHDPNEILEITVRQYLQISKCLQQNLKCYTVGVDFDDKEVLLDPYVLGAWLGGNETTMSGKTREEPLTIYKLIDNKHVPYDYKCNSRAVRLQLLAGLIDIGGCYTKTNKYVITLSCVIPGMSQVLADDIVYVCKSLGFYTSMKEVRVREDCTYAPHLQHKCKSTFCIYISGNGLDEIPVVSSTKQAPKHTVARGVNLLNFTIETVGEQPYYGFVVDKNHKYLLGNFIVTHNSTISSLVYAELKMMHKSVEIVPEVAKWLIYRGEFEKLNDQYFVSSDQYKLIKALDGKVEYVIGDSGILTGLYYNRAYKSNMSDVNKTEQLILKKNNEFNNIYIYVERNPQFAFEKEGRVHTEEESKKVDVELKEMLREFNISYKSFLSHRDSVQGIVEYILSQVDE